MDDRGGHGLETLLDLHGSVLDQGDGYWIKIEAWRTQVSDDVPHGIRYSLSLHEPHGKRLLGYDNAHAVRPRGGFRYAGNKSQRWPFDHRHRHLGDEGEPDGFQSAWQVLEYFFRGADRVLREVSGP